MKAHYLVGCPSCIKVMLAAEALDMKLDYIIYTNIPDLKAGVKDLNPKGQVPVLETPEGPLYESEAINRYIALQKPELGLAGKNTYDTALIDQWLANLTALYKGFIIQHLTVIGRWEKTAEEIKEKNEELHKALQLVEDRLSENNGRKYLISDYLTLADISLVTYLFYIYTYQFDEKKREQFPNVTRYYLDHSSRRYFTQSFGRKRIPGKPFEINLCD